MSFQHFITLSHFEQVGSLDAAKAPLSSHLAHIRKFKRIVKLCSRVFSSGLASDMSCAVPKNSELATLAREMWRNLSSLLRTPTFNRMDLNIQNALELCRLVNLVEVEKILWILAFLFDFICQMLKL